LKDLNFIPKQYLKKEKEKQNAIVTIYGAIGFCIILSISIAIPLWINNNLTNEKDKIFVQNKQLTGYIEKETQFNLVEKMLSDRDEQANKYKNKGVEVQNIWQEIERTLPDNVYFNSISIDLPNSSSVDINLGGGIASSEEVVASLIVNLRKIKSFNNIALSKLSKENNNFQFNLIINLKISG